MEIVFIPLIVSIFVFFIYTKIKLVYYRYLKSYTSEMVDFLQKERLEFIDFYYPKNIDWKNTPFTKPKNFTLNFSQIISNGIFITIIHKQYLIVLGINDKIEKKYWLEITTSYFSKPKLKFEESPKNNLSDDVITSTKIEYIKVMENCPACNYKLNNTENICPDCGIHF